MLLINKFVFLENSKFWNQNNDYFRNQNPL